MVEAANFDHGCGGWLYLWLECGVCDCGLREKETRRKEREEYFLLFYYIVYIILLGCM